VTSASISPFGALQSAQQSSGRPGAQVVAAVVAAHGHGVRQNGGAAFRAERGFQRHGLVNVRAAGLEVASRLDREMAAIGVKDAGENGWRVETRET